MGFYSQRIFPYLLDWSMSSADFGKYRQETLENVKGDVLEIGFGTGLNLSYLSPKRLIKSSRWM